MLKIDNSMGSDPIEFHDPTEFPINPINPQP
jgi:hypothetical protein